MEIPRLKINYGNDKLKNTLINGNWYVTIAARALTEQGYKESERCKFCVLLDKPAICEDAVCDGRYRPSGISVFYKTYQGKNARPVKVHLADGARDFRSVNHAADFLQTSPGNLHRAASQGYRITHKETGELVHVSFVDDTRR